MMNTEKSVNSICVGTYRGSGWRCTGRGTIAAKDSHGMLSLMSSTRHAKESFQPKLVALTVSWLVIGLPALAWFELSLDLHGGAPSHVPGRRSVLYALSEHCFRHPQCTANALTDRLVSHALLLGVLTVPVLAAVFAHKLGWLARPQTTAPAPQGTPTNLGAPKIGRPDATAIFKIRDTHFSAWTLGFFGAIACVTIAWIVSQPPRFAWLFGGSFGILVLGTMVMLRRLQHPAGILRISDLGIHYSPLSMDISWQDVKAIWVLYGKHGAQTFTLRSALGTLTLWQNEFDDALPKEVVDACFGRIPDKHVHEQIRQASERAVRRQRLTFVVFVFGALVLIAISLVMLH